MFDHFRHIQVVLALGLALVAAGCMTPERAMRETDRIGTSLAADYRRRLTGNTNTFSIARPSDRLRVRLQAGGAVLPGGTTTSTLPTGPLILTLNDALMAGARNSNEYQASKESVFSAALALQLQQHAFENTFAGLLGADVTRKESGGEGRDETTEQATGSAKATLSRKVSSGATLTAALGLDIARLLTGDGGSTLGLLGDATIKIPLLRGAGRLIATEPLTQAERNLIYAIYEFETFRQNYAVKVASGYYSLLEVSQRVLALQDNQQRLSDNYRRAELLFEAGRMSQVELDQTRQDLLRTGDQLVSAEQARQAQLDAFKLSLGLPVDAAIEIDRRELDRLNVAMGLDPGLTNAVPEQVPDLPFTESEALALALTNRHDLILSRYRLEDAARAVKIAADALRPELTLNGGVSAGQSRAGGRKTGDTTTYALGTDLNLPWERSAERNAYRGAVLALDSATRALEVAEDAAKDVVRRGFRDIQSSWSSFIIQAEALRVAMRRVRSSDLFQQAGRASTRDVLEAESALLNARNALVSAVVNYRMAGLELFRDLSALEISEEGLWREPIN
jgi:outer membrane protein TolC